MTKSCPALDVQRGLKGRARLLALVDRQRAWIDYCERNGVSYTGPNGVAIRAADRKALAALEAKLLALQATGW